MTYEFDGTHFRGRDIAQLPRPRQAGGPPVLIGGNSALSRRRAARNQGWSPLLVSQTVAETTRMPYLSVPQLAAQIAEVREAADDPGFTVQVQGPQTDVLRGAYLPEEHRDHLGELAAAGVDSFVLQLPCGSIDEAVAGLEQYAVDFF